MLSMFIVFTTLKLTGTISWSWFAVCVPLYYFILEVSVIVAFYKICKRIYKKHFKENRKKYPNFSEIGDKLSNKMKEIKIPENFDPNVIEKINNLKKEVEKKAGN